MIANQHIGASDNKSSAPSPHRQPPLRQKTNSFFEKSTKKEEHPSCTPL
nr:MAG TPA: hypothetical protein [Caudoviricetes sp.]